MQRLRTAAPTFRSALLQPLPRRCARACRTPIRATAAGFGMDGDDPYQARQRACALLVAHSVGLLTSVSLCSLTLLFSAEASCNGMAAEAWKQLPGVHTLLAGACRTVLFCAWLSYSVYERACSGLCAVAFPLPNASVCCSQTACHVPQVLGVRSDTSSETLQRAYRKRLSEAKGDKARTAAVEEAHSRIMMSNLSARMKVRAGRLPNAVPDCADCAHGEHATASSACTRRSTLSHYMCSHVPCEDDEHALFRTACHNEHVLLCMPCRVAA